MLIFTSKVSDKDGATHMQQMLKEISSGSREEKGEIAFDRKIISQVPY